LSIDFDEVEAFLVLSEELHFGRTAERLHRSQTRVSRLIASLESKIGGALFERTSRRVAVTPLGAQMEKRLRMAYAEILIVFDEAVTSARSTSGTLRIGVTRTTDRPAFGRLVDTFSRRHPECRATIVEIDMWKPYAALRAGEIDVLCNWLAIDEPDLKVGPTIEECPRALAVKAGHPLTRRPSVSIEDVAQYRINRTPEWFPVALREAIQPSHTHSGRPIPRTDQPITSVPEVLNQTALGNIVSVTIESAPHLARGDLTLLPINDMPPLPLGLIWCAARENERIRALAQTAAIRTGRPPSGQPPIT
jgi:DNA-binding transcriptional LysR family regulator